jgi:hypothetical protein
MRTPTTTQATLQSAANQIFAVVAPTTARLVHIQVLLDEQVDTACTDGRVVIALPPVFCGVDVSAASSLAVGLLAHEVGHFLQPLAAVEAVERETNAPPWLSNVVLDIQDEMLMATLFPGLAGPLEHARTVVHQTHVAGYLQALQAATSFASAAGSASLLGRFAQPQEPFDLDWLTQGSGVVSSHLRNQLAQQAWWPTLEQFLVQLWGVRTAAAHELPAVVQQLMEQFPALQQAPAPTLPYPDPHRPVLGGTLEPEGSVRLEATRLVGAVGPTGPVMVHDQAFTPRPAEPEAQRLGRTLRSHFEATPGAIEVVAPGRFARREVARPEGIPFRMALAGREVPAPRVVIALDMSDSMADDRKLQTARLAAQALAVAIRAVQGEVVGVLFSDGAVMGTRQDMAPLFAPRTEWLEGGTSFLFLPDLWRRFPDHRLILVTDGDGPIPYATPADKARTAAIVIPPGAKLDLMQQIADRVAVVRDVTQLAWVLAMLIPRRTVG